MSKKLILGTSKWGENMLIDDIMPLMESWYHRYGMDGIDTGTNYPINGKDGFTAIYYLEEFLNMNKGLELDITLKIGSVSRNRVPDFNLNPDFVERVCEENFSRLGKSVKCVMVHWDNRENEEEIIRTLETIAGYGVRVGISGIMHPKQYSEVISSLNLCVDIQTRYSNITHYLPHFPPELHRYHAYRVSEGQDDYLIGLRNACLNPHLSGILIAPSTIQQLTHSIQCYAENSGQTHLQDDDALPPTVLRKNCRTAVEGSKFN